MNVSMKKKISDEQWVLFLSMLKICRSIKLAAERCGIAPGTAYHRGYMNVEFFQEVTKILQGDYEAQCLPSIIKVAEDMGSGSTGCAAVLEGCDFVGIDITPEYMAIAQKRIAHYAVESPLEGMLY